MGLPSKKRTPRSKKERASHFALKPVATVKCGNCAKPMLPHRACPHCGFYKGKDVVGATKRATRRVRSTKKA